MTERKDWLQGLSTEDTYSMSRVASLWRRDCTYTAKLIEDVNMATCQHFVYMPCFSESSSDTIGQILSPWNITPLGTLQHNWMHV